MIKRRLGQIARMCGGQCDAAFADIEIAGVGKDSRQVEAGSLYVPIVGERFDGHDYAAGALADGAAASLWQQDKAVPEELKEAPLVFVDDPLAALQRLAAAYRNELPVKVIGITGSNGKTTTKDMVAAVLSAKFRVHKTAGNLNNHIGLPLTVLQLDETVEAAVLEMGMSGFGEIELLTRIAQPDIAVITNIGDAHLLQLGSREGITQAKLEITAGLREDGLLLFNGDEPLLHAGLQKTVLPQGVRTATFGLSEQNDWSPAQIEVEAAASSFSVRESDNWHYAPAVHIPVPGKHNVSNALAAIAVARSLGVPEPDIAKALQAGLTLTGMRIQPVAAFNGAMILNDAYNANPTAVRAAVDLVGQLSGFRRKWVVLGDMLELGPDEDALHREIGEYVTPDKADALLAFGPLSKHTADAAKPLFAGKDQSLIRHFEDQEELAGFLRSELQAEDLVLVKGSRGMRMEKIVHVLEAR
ncbi:UDP-N-acetylmuramoyl-tripeptide--D-alanyl-D-alanine ligase [Paenibacillus protaetiae]|uniref:UDP-N-acetylmuramoyl-tripeptide--D-alanyl-D-alanine ligase n=1 Tax=Paenibacillus protaetiae TaxID=2509456 RepID=A0A4P6ER06_9BACL|nr:UDP-N-acetylmuramoyl-tripeptide--D-alanyl-D-alanine ligase [Paenibacillus protaetiae]QAY65420.1 UDP-N-acetylmuramoyl-tripeptide--D-alanyl-D-alanine ligase [Paenibacillus protaetiae]